MCEISFLILDFVLPLNLTDIVLLLLTDFFIFQIKCYTLVYFSYSMNPQYPCKICKDEVEGKYPSLCRECHIECVNICPITYEKL